MSAPCPLCGGESLDLWEGRGRRYHRCGTCAGIFLEEGQRLGREDEKGRYEMHRNDAEDPGYRSFVSPVAEAIARDQSPGRRGLDFGAGRDSAVSRILREGGYDIEEYDPYFRDRPELLGRRYDYIACCEVMEHFYRPRAEFELLRRLLEPGGRLYCMTHLFDETADFGAWYYKEDPTHVFIYGAATIRWIEESLGFSGAAIEGRLIVFSR